MNPPTPQPIRSQLITLVLASTGKTGRRIVQQLESHGVTVRRGSRSASPLFDWNREKSWDACLRNVESVYLNYAPDLAIPGAADSIQTLVNRARGHGVKHVVLLSGRGEEEAQKCESIVQQSGMTWTIVRASWFNQNFSEGAFHPMVMKGEITLPAGEIAEPFVDVDDIAEIAVAALTDPRHHGQVYEVTGPELLTFQDLANELSRATGRPITYQRIPHDAFVASARQNGAPEEVTWMLDYLFSTVLDGRNAYLTDGVQRALGRAPKSFAAYAHEVARNGGWEEAV